GPCRDAIDGNLLFPAVKYLHPAAKIPVPAGNTALYPEPLGPKADQLPVAAGPGRFSTGQTANGLQEIGFPLGILSPDHVAYRVKFHRFSTVVAEILQQEAVNSHRLPYIVFPGRTLCPRGGSFSPAGGRFPR